MCPPHAWWWQETEWKKVNHIMTSTIQKVMDRKGQRAVLRWHESQMTEAFGVRLEKWWPEGAGGSWESIHTSNPAVQWLCGVQDHGSQGGPSVRRDPVKGTHREDASIHINVNWASTACQLRHQFLNNHLMLEEAQEKRSGLDEKNMEEADSKSSWQDTLSGSLLLDGD